MTEKIMLNAIARTDKTLEPTHSRNNVILKGQITEGAKSLIYRYAVFCYLYEFVKRRINTEQSAINTSI